LVDTGVEDSDIAGAIHGAEHAGIGMLPLFASCDRWDIGGVSTPMHPDTGEITIFIYDGLPGGGWGSPNRFRQRTAVDGRHPRSGAVMPV